MLLFYRSCRAALRRLLTSDPDTSTVSLGAALQRGGADTAAQALPSGLRGSTSDPRCSSAEHLISLCSEQECTANPIEERLLPQTNTQDG